ncbi:MAG: hypothetical protein FWE23_02265 [Chitinivibrionia bacterium]|nr:hypothetical protein [Chitinivibrionia bacterium]
MKAFFLWLIQFTGRCVLRAWQYLEARRSDYSSLFFNSVLVFLAAMVLSDEWDTKLGFIFMAVFLLLGTIFSKGGK